MKKRSNCALICLIVALLAALGPRSRAGADEPYEIYAIVPMTGFASFIGQGISTTLGIVEDQVNKSGGIRGRSVKFVIQDDQSSPQTAVQLTNALIAKKVPVFIGSSIAAMCQAQAPLVHQGPVQWCISPVIRPTPGSFTFTVAHTTDDYIAACLRYSRGRNWHKVAILTTTDASGQDFDASFDRVLARNENRDAAIVSHEHFNIADISAAAQITRIKNANPDVVFGWAAGTAMGTVLRGLNDAGVELPVFTTPANLLYAQMRSLSAWLPKELLFPGNPAYAPELLKGPDHQAVSAYLDAFRARGIQPDQAYAMSWNPALLIVEALRKYGTTATAAQVKDYISNYRGPGILGHYNFPEVPQRGLDESGIIILRWDRGRNNWLAVSGPGGKASSRAGS